MTKKKEVKFRPAGLEDNNTYVGYTNIAANEKETELKVEGTKYNNNETTLGIKVSNNVLIIDHQKNTVTREINGKVVSVSNVDEAKIKRLQEKARKEELERVGKQDEVR